MALSNGCLYHVIKLSWFVLIRDNSLELKGNVELENLHLLNT
jgi:hypothetical protein